MPKYQAKYTVKAMMCDGGCWVPDLDSHNPEHSFDAKDDDEAQKLAEEHKSVLRKDYFGPKITLDELLKVEKKIELKPKGPMMKYRARYTLNAQMCDGGAWLPCPENDRQTYTFDARTDEDARQIAEDYKHTLKANYFSPTADLDALVRLEKEMKMMEVEKEVRLDDKS